MPLKNPVQTYEQALAEVDKIADYLGKPVDDKIKPLVAAMRMWGIETTGSCEGHVGRGLSYPWVDVPYSSVELAGKLLCTVVEGTSHDWVFKPYATWMRFMPRQQFLELETHHDGALRLAINLSRMRF